MGSSCSSGQSHKDKDNSSTRSEESPSYQVAQKPSAEATVGSGVVLSVSNANPNPPQPPKSSVSDSLPPSSPAPPVPEKKPSVRNQLWDIVPTLKSRKIVLYISAADSQDCKVEKSLIHHEIYPELREVAREAGFELHIIDLHWSIQERTVEPSELILHELSRQLERCYVVPVVLLNSALGAPLLPKTIEMADFQTLSQADQGLMCKWYALDQHSQPPCYRLQPASTHIPQLKSEIREERDAALESWRSEVDKILNLMLSAFSQELKDTYLTTVVEQEVHHTVMMSQELGKRCVWLSRVFTHTNEAEGGSPGDAELRRRLEVLQKGLKSELSESNIVRLTVKWSPNGVDQTNPDHAQYLAQVSATLKKRLRAIIDTIIEDHVNKMATLSITTGLQSYLGLLEEISSQNSWARKLSKCSVNRQELLQEIQRYSGDGVLVVTGPRGSGKTTLLSRVAQAVQRDAEVVFRSANLTAASSTLLNTLRSVLKQLCALGQTPFPWTQHRLEVYSTRLEELLKEVGKDPIILIIDGIDQFLYGSKSVDWVPKVLPDNVRLLVSLDESGTISALKSRLEGTNAQFYQMSPLTESEGQSLLSSSVAEYSHSVSPGVQDSALASLRSCALPLYVKALAWESALRPQTTPAPDLPAQIDRLFTLLEDSLGKEKVGTALALLLVSKWGLTDSEMVDLLSSLPLYHTSTTYCHWAGAIIFWSRLVKALSPFMEVGHAATNRLPDLALTSSAKARYSALLPIASKHLLAYFRGDLWKGKTEIKARTSPQTNTIGKGYNARKLEELPFQQNKVEGSCKNLLKDHAWVFHKLVGSSVYQVLEDIELGSDEGLTPFKSILEEYCTALEYDGRQLYSVLAKSKIQYDFPSDPPTNSLVQVDSKGVETGSGKFTSLVRLPEKNCFVVTISVEKEEIGVWDLRSCQRVRTLKEVPQPLSLQMIDDYKCVVLCKRELWTYDLDKGVLLTKLKGVMNQKMPYYGLHDSSHLVALSRNRMYVNLMNLDTGDLVTTFKAGEDRFLNSLLVSGDGRMLVCGDETQKPFPLLVWNLASRKLLYDLRIPQHDFITSLSAITHQGHYVSCVAKEVDEPSPNYIVVYDLQSGTLFKKWKPGVDCVSLDISSGEGCVVSGHADGLILVWDLITGNCRHSLKGHTAPVTHLRLSPMSATHLCLSTDLQGRDPSIRLWHLTRGEMMAVFTPSSRITACELTDRRVVLTTETDSDLISLELVGPDLPPLEDSEGEYGEAR